MLTTKKNSKTFKYKTTAEHHFTKVLIQNVHLHNYFRFS